MAISDEAYKPRYKEKPKKKERGVKGLLPHKGDSKKEVVSKIIVLVSLVVLIVCGVILGIYFFEMYEAKQNHNTIQLIYQNAQTGIEETTQAQTSYAEEEAERQPLEYLPAAKELLEINKDTVGYVQIPDLMNEVVVQGSDNEYYLDHNFYGNQRQCGTVFADYRCIINDYPDKMSDNITLYGHNQKDGTMFGTLDKYKWDYSYWLKNPFIYFDTNYEQGTYVIIASFVTNTKPEHDNGYVFDYQNYSKFQDTGTYTYENFVKEITERSTIITGVDVQKGDKFLTLSTCSYEWDEARHVIVARKLRSGETEKSIDTTKFQKNPNPKWPAIYYKYNGGTYVESN
jgi:SrtB family sortase